LRLRLFDRLTEALGIKILKRQKFNKLRQDSKAFAVSNAGLNVVVKSFANLTPADFENLVLSKAQLHQDLFVLSHLNFKRDGFFVEFGATDGIEYSNTFLLEKKFGWQGILAEPARVWHQSLKENRTATIDNRCVWSVSGEELMFEETPQAVFSTISTFKDSDGHKKIREGAVRYPVLTISLNDLLKENQAPRHIDYLSIDTEGSELDILSAVDFDFYSFGVITCEHNFTDNREKIHTLLVSHGYQRKLQDLSKFDDWYVKT
jgi:FkbM family methyltransferase